MASDGDAGAPSTNDVYIEHVSRAFALGVQNTITGKKKLFRPLREQQDQKL
jgi:hypothetical protein